MAYTKQPTDPDYAHGTETGKVNGCDCTACNDAGWRAGKRRRVARARGVALTADPAKQAEIRAHITMLREAHPGNTLQAIGAAAGISSSTLSWFLMGKTKKMHKSTFTKVLAVKPHHITAKDFYPREDLVLLVGQLRALGYPVAWQARECGVPRLDVSIDLRRGSGPVQASIYNALREVHTRVGDRPATDAHAPKGVRTRTMNEARAAGFYPPACYEPDGTLDWRAIPDHPWTVIEEQCHEHIARLEAAIKHPDVGARGLTHITLDYTEDDYAPGTSEHTEFGRVEMAYRRLLEGLRIRNSDTGAERRAELHEALWRFMHKGEGDPVSFCIEQGIMSEKSSKIPSDHPAVAKARAEAAEERKARKASNEEARTAAAKEARRVAEAAKRAAFTPEEREAYNERKRNQRRNARTSQREQVAA